VTPEQARTAAPDVFAVIPGCAHLPPAEDPAAVADLLASFFNSAKGGVDTVRLSAARLWESRDG
jgi:hypothetical protein